MKILCISDTHNQHKNIPVDLIDNKDESIQVIIHAGDVSGSGTFGEITNFLTWYNELPFKYKILIAGNHDFWFEKAPKEVIENTLSLYKNIIYLNDSGIEIEGFNFWGSPVQPWFYNWAFNRIDAGIKPHWDIIPENTHVLITHGPIKGFLDMTMRGDSTGCPYLRDRIIDLKDLKLHVCGHIHEAYGKFEAFNGCQLVNASLLNHRYYMTNEPIIIEINK